MTKRCLPWDHDYILIETIGNVLIFECIKCEHTKARVSK